MSVTTEPVPPRAWSLLRSRRGLRHLALTGLAAFTSAGLGAAATRPDTAWYRSLEKPPWDPPTIAYPLVWTPLYADLALTTAAALTALEDEAEQGSEASDVEAAALRRVLALNLVLNTGWSVVFWQVRRPALAAVWCGVLAVHSAGLVRRVHAVDPALGAALAPYPAWCAFATALNTSIALRNR